MNNIPSRFPIITLMIGLLFVLILQVLTGIAYSKESAFNKNSKQYFRHIMFRETPFASYRGIHPVASDNPPNFAHYEFSYDELNRISGIRYQVNNSLIRRNEVFDSFIWFAPEVRIEYSAERETHTYYNLEGEQIEAHGAVYTAVYTLNDKGRRVSLAFFDKQGQPSESAWNVHRYEWREKNGLVYEKRFDLKDQQRPLRPEFEFYEIELEYDRDGKLAFLRNLGLEGIPTNNESGAGIDRIVYDPKGNFIRWMVYDKDGNPVEGNHPMVHLGEHLYDHLGNKIGLRGFDRYGKRIPFSWGTYEHVNTYNQHGNAEELLMFDSESQMTRHLLIEYNQEQSQIIWLKSLDEKRELVASPMLGGAAALQYIYEDDGSVSRELYNVDMTSFTPPAQATTN